MRKIGTKLPPPFPNGWYRLAASREIKPGKAKHIDCLGENFVVFRSQESNDVFVLDAYCPHMGANIGKNSIYEPNIFFLNFLELNSNIKIELLRQPCTTILKNLFEFHWIPGIPIK